MATTVQDFLPTATDKVGSMKIISQTAVQHGFGTAQWKRVVRLTRVEGQLARADGMVLFHGDTRSGGANGTGTCWRKVRWDGRYRMYRPRVPTQAEVEGAGGVWDGR